MKTTSILFAALLLMATSCTRTNDSSNQTNKLKEQYKEVPKDELVKDDPKAVSIYSTLTQRYTNDLLALKNEVESNHAKFELVFLTPECGQSSTIGQQKGKQLIQEFSAKQAMSFTDLTLPLLDKDPTVITQMPKDGHWSKEGARIVASELANLIQKNKGYMVPNNDNLTSKPETFGDLDANVDEILDGGKDLPYRMITNAAGLRMNHAISFPKKKQRILLLGDSIFFCPFLDNQDGISEQLQTMYPDAEIVNAANWGYSIDDYLSLYKEKAKFLEADIVIVETNGNDILDYFFSNRLKLSRNPSAIIPSSAELDFYNGLYSNK